jgi:GDP-4-dehydro-6-deoxy-D-mannose reductase
LSQRTYPETSFSHQVSDITNINSISSVLKAVKPDYMFHLAGITYADDPALFYRLNTQYAVALFYALEAAGLYSCPVLLVGTSAEYGNVSHDQLPIHENIPPQPYNHYGISKLAQTYEGVAAHRRGLPVIIVRPFNVIGTDMHDNLVVQAFALQLKEIGKGLKPPVINVGNLESTRDFVDVEDIVSIYWKLVNAPSSYGEIINICTGRGTSINDILLKLIALSGVNVKVEFDRSRFKPVDVPEHYGCTKKMQRIIGYVPKTDLDISLKRILEWLEHQL